MGYRDVTVGGLLTLLARDFPGNEALVHRERGWRLSFAELEEESRLIARGLIGAGVGRGDRVAIWATNVPEWVVLQFALAKIGAVLVTVNTSLRASEVKYLLSQSEAETIFTIRGHRDVDYVACLREIGAFDKLKRVIFIGDEVVSGAMPYDDLRGLAQAVSEADLDALSSRVGINDVINMQYTSGTTGFPKGVMLSSRNIVNNGYWLGQGLAYTPADRLCLCVPLFHCFGCVIGVLGAYTHGACLVMLDHFEPRRVLEAIAQERCTSVYGVPTMFLAEMDHPDFSKFNLSSLRTGVMAGALCPEVLMRRAIEEMNLREITIIYGLTEASPGITQTLRDDTIEHRTQTVGKVLPEMEVRIVEPATVKQVGIDEPGELCVRGYNVMLGYYKNQKATEQAIDSEGWLKTGDQAAMDADGYVRITGRIKDLIIRGGENIAPKEIEDVLRQHPAIADAYVYAVKSHFFGEEVAVAIRLKPGAKVTEEEVRSFCRGRIARFKVPHYVKFVEDYPMTASGKIQKFILREKHERELGL
jgi:fatty-acyl-CoA synthase